MTLVSALKNAYATSFTSDAADLLGRLSPDGLEQETRDLDVEALVAVLDRLAPSRAHAVFVRLDPTAADRVLEEASSRLGAMLLGWLDAEERDRRLARLPASVSGDYRRLLDYPPDTAGRLMERVVDTIRSRQSIGEARAQLRDSGIVRARTLYVVDDKQCLVGSLDVQSLALGDPDSIVASQMRSVQAYVSPTDPRDEIVALLDKHRIDSVPVVDLDGRLIGVVRYATLFAAIEAVASADMQKMVGVSADERALSGAGFTVRRRLPWLHVNLVTAFIAAAVVGLFENLIAQFTALAVLLPVVAGQSGNAGSQALAVTIRGLALKEISTREWRQVLRKELFVGATNGVALAFTCGAGVWLWSGSIGLALVIGVAMILSMIAAGISGALVPVVLTRLGQDPATASSIILTTVTDVAGFFSFLGTATALSFML